MTILGVDLGTKHLGLALADGPLARPLPTLTHTSLVHSCVRLVQLAQTHGVSTIVLGLPEGRLVGLVNSFVQELANHTSIPVVTHPESLTTAEALSKLRTAGAKRKKLRNEHSYAACLLLEDYLEAN